MRLIKTFIASAALAVASTAAWAAPVATFDVGGDFAGSNDGQVSSLSITNGTFAGELIDLGALTSTQDLVFSATLSATTDASPLAVVDSVSFQVDGINLANALGGVAAGILSSTDPLAVGLVSFIGDLLDDGNATVGSVNQGLGLSINGAATTLTMTEIAGTYGLQAALPTGLVNAGLNLFGFGPLPQGQLTGSFELALAIDTVAPIPLPAGLPLLLAGLGALGAARRLRAA